MKVFWVVVGVVGGAVVLYAVGSGIRTATLASKGKALADAAKPFERRTTSGDANAAFKILILGDSSAVGVGASNPAHSLPGLLSARLPNASVENIAINGARTSEVAAQLPRASEQHYDLALVQIGGNDVTHVTPFESTNRDLAAALDLLKPRADKVIVITSGEFSSAPIWPWPLNVFYGHRNRQLQRNFTAVCAEHGATYVSIVDHEDASNIKKDATYYAVDGFHPNDKGYAEWFAALNEKLLELGL